MERKMKMNLLNSSAIALGLLVAACGSNEGTQNLQNDVAAGDMNAMMADPNNPFGQSEMQMHERMMAAQGANASETWVRKMIEHYRGAIAMNDVLIRQGGAPAVVEKARKTSDDQGKEVQQLERMLQAGGIGAGTSGNADPYSQSEKVMHDRMMAAKGANLSETWTRKMIEHHRGAVDMSNVLIRQGGDPKVLESARMTVQKQQKEIEELERMLPGETPATAASGAGSTLAPAKAQPRAETKAPSKPEARVALPKPAPPAQPKVEPKTPAAPATCTPEHRALGHC